MEENEMTMDLETRKSIERYFDEGEAAFDRLLAEGESKRHRRVVRRAAGFAAACAAAVALVLWLVPARPSSGEPLTPVQIAEGIRQMMLLDIGDIESIVATPKDSYAILTARLKDGSTCSYILKCNDAEGTATLLAYNNKPSKK